MKILRNLVSLILPIIVVIIVPISIEDDFHILAKLRLGENKIEQANSLIDKAIENARMKNAWCNSLNPSTDSRLVQ